MKTKKCENGKQYPSCGKIKPLSDFSVDVKGRPYRTCKRCMQIRSSLRRNYPELLPKSPEPTACTACGIVKPIDDFGYQPGSGGVPHPTCRRCREQAHQRDYAKNRAPKYPPSGEGSKPCNQCHRTLPRTDFGPAASHTDGRTNKCHPCTMANQTARLDRLGIRIKPLRTCLRCKKPFKKVGCEQVCPPCRTVALAVTEKTCHSGKKVPGCGQMLPIEKFGPAPSTLDGRMVTCNECCHRHYYDKDRMKREAKRLQRKKLIDEVKYAKLQQKREEREAIPNLQADLAERGLRLCTGTKRNLGCNLVKPITKFEMRTTNNTRSPRCRLCEMHIPGRREMRRKRVRAARLRDPGRYAARKALREFRGNAAPKWLTAEQKREITDIYRERNEMRLSTGIEHEVDHIIPLNGKEALLSGDIVEVCGLHVPWNLRVCTREENQAKSNKFLQWADAIFLAQTKYSPGEQKPLDKIRKV